MTEPTSGAEVLSPVAESDHRARPGHRFARRRPRRACRPRPSTPSRSCSSPWSTTPLRSARPGGSPASRRPGAPLTPKRPSGTWTSSRPTEGWPTTAPPGPTARYPAAPTRRRSRRPRRRKRRSPPNWPKVGVTSRPSRITGPLPARPSGRASRPVLALQFRRARDPAIAHPEVVSARPDLAVPINRGRPPSPQDG